MIDSILVVFFKYLISSSRVKPYVWPKWVIHGNGDIFGSLPCWWHCSDTLILVLQGKNLEFDLWWLDPVITMLEHRSLLEGVVEELVVLVVSIDGGCRYSRWCSLLISLLIAFLSFFSSLGHSFGLVWFCYLPAYFSVCMHEYWLCTFWPYRETGCLLIVFVLTWSFILSQ